jgi:polyhydroxybutyrate depolymerase
MAMLDALIGKCLKDVGDVPIFVSGHSNGSGMSFRFAKESSRRVVAMGVVSGTKAVETPGKLKGSIPTLYIAGEKDPITPWEGGRTKTPWGEKESPAVLKMMDDWATWQGLKVPAEKNPASGGVVTYRYGDVVEVRCVLGHGHAWPGAKADSVAVERAMGPNVAKFDATREILAWFESALR